jgi:hypothetical protein
MSDSQTRYSTRKEVTQANQQRLDQLPGVLQTYEARDHSQKLSKEARGALLDHLMAPPQLMLKSGAQVMLIRNLQTGLGPFANGTVGRVTGFCHVDRWTGVRTREKEDHTGWHGADVVWPLVRFQDEKGGQLEHDILIVPEAFKVEDRKGDVLASRSQVSTMIASGIRSMTLKCND